VNLVDEHPLVKAADAKLADLERRRAEFEANVAPLAEADAAAEAEYNKAVDAALLERAPMPSPPVRKIPPGRDVEIRLGFIQEQQRLTEERSRAVAAAYDDVLREVRSQATKLLRTARPTVEKLTTVMADLVGLLHAVRTCRTAKNTESTDGHRDYHDAKLDVDAFTRLVATGDDPTSILDLTGAGKIQPHRSGLTLGDVQQLLNARA
jgi:hypothetical protein